MSTKYYCFDEKTGTATQVQLIDAEMSALNNPAVRETVNHPPHYNSGRIEVIDAIEDWSLNFNLGNAVKYIARARLKGKEVEDIKKAIWYLNRHLETLTKEKK